MRSGWRSARRRCPPSPRASLFEGLAHGDGVELSFFVTSTPPDRGPPLHVHPNAEVFLVEQGQATFTIGEDEIVGLNIPTGIPLVYRLDESMAPISVPKLMEIVTTHLLTAGRAGTAAGRAGSFACCLGRAE